MPRFKKPFHRAIAKLAQDLDPQFLLDCRCFFGGGTQIALSHGEYRQSRDVDFLCSSRDGFRQLRETVTERSLGKIFRRPVTLAREIRADRDGIRTVVELDKLLIKFEIVLEARIDLNGAIGDVLPIPTLNFDPIVAEKLLANADRGLDESTRSRDLVDLAFIAAESGVASLRPGMALAETAYGAVVKRNLGLVLDKFADQPRYLAEVSRSLGIEDLKVLRRGLTTLGKLRSRDLER